VRLRAIAWLVASALCIGAAIVAIMVLKPHWQARELDWMLGGGAVLVACMFATQACFRRANRGPVPWVRDFEGELLERIEDTRELGHLQDQTAAALEGLDEMLDTEGAHAVRQLRASLAGRDRTAERVLEDHSRRMRRSRGLARLLAWAAALATAVVLLELRR
jgi:hypothetical protein